MNASLSPVSGVTVEVTQSGAGPVTFVATQPAGNAGAVTPSKFCDAPGHGVGVGGPAVGVGVGVGDGVGVGVGVPVGPDVGVGVPVGPGVGVGPPTGA